MTRSQAVRPLTLARSYRAGALLALKASGVCPSTLRLARTEQEVWKATGSVAIFSQLLFATLPVVAILRSHTIDIIFASVIVSLALIRLVRRSLQLLDRTAGRKFRLRTICHYMAVILVSLAMSNLLKLQIFETEIATQRTTQRVTQGLSTDLTVLWNATYANAGAKAPLAIDALCLVVALAPMVMAPTQRSRGTYALLRRSVPIELLKKDPTHD